MSECSTGLDSRRDEMPGENRDQLARGGGGGGERGGGDGGGSVPGRRESSRGGGGGGGSEPDSRNRGLTTMIPLPRTGQFATASQNQKIVKTERNRLRLIMENRGAVAASDVLDKEQRISIREEDASQDNWRVSAANCSTIPTAKVTGRAISTSKVQTSPSPSRSPSPTR